MITWMQRHKKYLVVTIWISVIAFVGAGFVGFGSVDLNTSRAKYVAKVGDLGITYKEFQNKFSELYSLQNQLSNGELTQELALNLNLDMQALVSLIQNKLFLNYALDLGLYASDDEVLQSLVKEEYFKKDDGSFDKDKYFSFLKSSGMKAADFEKQIKDEIIVKKLFDLLKLPVNDNELEMVASSLFMQDEINMKVIDLSKEKDNIQINENELKAFWEEHKDDYKSEQTYEYSLTIVEPSLDIDENELKAFWEEHKYNYKDNDEKIKTYEEAKELAKIDLGLEKSEKEANLKYIDLKKAKIAFDKEITEKSNSALAYILKDLKANEISKPFKNNGKYFIVRLNKINYPTALDYEAAKELAIVDFKNEKFNELMIKIGEEESKKDEINGKNIGFITKDSSNITDLDDIEFYTFINELFLKNTKKSFVVLSDKVIVYEILSQRLDNNEKLNENKSSLIKSLDDIKQKVMINDLLQELMKRYKVINFYEKGSVN